MKCQQCALCCETYPIDVAYSDVVRWRFSARRDILQEVSFINNYPEKGYAGFYVEKTLHNPKIPCPFLQDSLCSIYDTRPLVCKDFPLSHDKTSCPSFEGVDELRRVKINDKQLGDMKKALDNYNDMMAILLWARH